jgi:hypothetical protein
MFNTKIGIFWKLCILPFRGVLSQPQIGFSHVYSSRSCDGLCALELLYIPAETKSAGNWPKQILFHFSFMAVCIPIRFRPVARCAINFIRGHNKLNHHSLLQGNQIKMLKVWAGSSRTTFSWKYPFNLGHLFPGLLTVLCGRGKWAPFPCSQRPAEKHLNMAAMAAAIRRSHRAPTSFPRPPSPANTFYSPTAGDRPSRATATARCWPLAAAAVWAAVKTAARSPAAAAAGQKRAARGRAAAAAIRGKAGTPPVSRCEGVRGWVGSAGLAAVGIRRRSRPAAHRIQIINREASRIQKKLNFQTDNTICYKILMIFVQYF